MVQNIAIIGLDRNMAYDVSKTLAGELDMFFFDALELFEFDNIPKTFSSMLKEYGVEYYRGKEKSIIGYSSEFNNCVINLEGGMAENENNFKKLKETCLIVYLAVAPNIVKEKIEKVIYKTPEEEEFFNVDYETLKRRAEALEKNSDVIVNASEGSQLKIVSEIIRAMKNYYIK